MCECYRVGGRFIAEDPDCPTHGVLAVKEAYEAEQRDEAKAQILATICLTVDAQAEQIRRLEDAVTLMASRFSMLTEAVSQIGRNV
jgi:hypothetical protein